MFKFFDRYILREIAPPFGIGLLLCTFVLLMNQILVLSELFIAKGVSFGLAAEVLIYLIPALLAFAVPMAVLMGILAGLSRLSTDSEITAFRTLGISSRRLAWPLFVFAFAGWLVTSYLTLFLAPRANYKWVQTITGSVLAKVQVRIVPREFNETVPKMVLYIQEIDRDKTWRNVFVYLTKDPAEPRLILAREGRLDLFPEAKKATLVLTDGTVHSYPLADPEKYSITSFKRLEEGIDVESLFASMAGRKRVREKDILELREGVRELRADLALRESEEKAVAKPGAEKAETAAPDRALRDMTRDLRAHWVEIHKKFALPFVCFIFVLLGLPLGMTTKKGRADERLHHQHRRHPALLHPDHRRGEAGHGRPGPALPGDVGPEHPPLRGRPLSVPEVAEGDLPLFRAGGLPSKARGARRPGPPAAPGRAPIPPASRSASPTSSTGTSSGSTWPSSP